MPYTTTEILNKVKTYVDEDYSGYYSTAQYTRFGQKAVQNVIQQKIDEFENTQKISEDLKPLLVTVTLNSGSTPPIQNGNFIDLTNATLNYGYLISALVTYTGSSVQRQSTPQYYVERGDVFSTGSTRYPKYRRSNKNLYFEPSSPAITSIEFTYFKEPKVTTDLTQLDFTVPVYTLAYRDKVVEEIINEMQRLIAENMREELEYQFATNNRTLDKTQ